MKKRFGYLFAAVIAVCAMFLAACEKEPSVEDQYTQINYMDMDFIHRASTPQDLPLVSDLVVLFVPDAKENELSYFGDGMIAEGHTKTTGTVTKVLQGDVEEGSKISLTEVYYVTSDGVLWTIDGYLPMQPDEEYLLFLRAYDEDSAFHGLYHITDRAFGKYIPGAQTRAQHQVNERINMELYEQWAIAVQEMYPEVFD